MPELPEVETIYRGLARRLIGLRVLSVVVSRADLRRNVDPGLANRLRGATVTELARRGKYLILRSDRGDSVIIHLGMSGRLVISARDVVVAPHTHLVVDFSDDTQLRFTDPRRFGAIDLVATHDEASWPALSRLGPEPLDPDFSAHYLAAQLSGRRTSVKAAFLDQRLVAGLGNIYVCEILYRARVSPLTLCRNVPAARIRRLVEETRHVLEAAIAAGGTTLRDYVGADGQPGAYASLHLVYDRAGQPCPQCALSGRAQMIRRIVQSGRSSFYCPVCQRDPQNLSVDKEMLDGRDETG